MRWPRLTVSPSSTMHARTVLDTVGRPLGAVGIDDRNHHVADHRDQVTFAVARDRLVLDDDLAFEVRLDERLLVDLRRTADVEGAHGQLRAGLADRLRRDDADRLAVVDRRAAGEIAPVAFAADAVDEFAGQRRADLHFLDAGLLDGVSTWVSSISVPRLTSTLLLRGIAHVVARRAARGCASPARPPRCRHR